MRTWIGIGLLLLQASSRAGASEPKAVGATYQMIACWFGGMWGDALGEPAAVRMSASERRCHEAVTGVFGKDDAERYQQLRSLEPAAIDESAKAIGKQASDLSAPDQNDLLVLYRAVAAAQRENLVARRAAERVRKDVNQDRPPQKLSTDERAAIEPFGKHEALEALLLLKAGRFSHDAHALGVLAAMDRVEMASGLPKHLKLYATEPAFKLLFNVELPPMPADPAVPLEPGKWLAQLERVAAAARHPVPKDMKAPISRHDAAWAGMLKGIGDRLRLDSAKASAPLKPVLDGTVRRLEK